jgi:hypothetical protein
MDLSRLERRDRGREMIDGQATGAGWRGEVGPASGAFLRVAEDRKQKKEVEFERNLDKARLTHCLPVEELRGPSRARTSKIPARSGTTDATSFGPGFSISCIRTFPASHHLPKIPKNQTPASRLSPSSGSDQTDELDGGLVARSCRTRAGWLGGTVTRVNRPKSRRVYWGVRREMETRLANRKGTR